MASRADGTPLDKLFHGKGWNPLFDNMNQAYGFWAETEIRKWN